MASDAGSGEGTDDSGNQSGSQEEIGSQADDENAGSNEDGNADAGEDGSDEETRQSGTQARRSTRSHLAPVIPGTHCLRRYTVIATDPCLVCDPNRGGAQVYPSRQRVARPGRHRDHPWAAAIAIVVVSSGTSYRPDGHRSSANLVLGI
jgi:hypothetical protein